MKKICSSPLGEFTEGVRVPHSFFFAIKGKKLWEKIKQRRETHAKSKHAWYDHDTLIGIYEQYKKAKFGQDKRPYWEIKHPAYEDNVQRRGARDKGQLLPNVLEEEE